MRAKSNHLHPQVVGFDEAQKGHSFPYIRTDGKRSDINRCKLNILQMNASLGGPEKY